LSNIFSNGEPLLRNLQAARLQHISRHFLDSQHGGIAQAAVPLYDID